MCKLFIIGNGFDIASGLSTRYSDFRNYMRSVYEPEDEIADRMPISETVGLITSYDENDMGKFLYHLINNTCNDGNWSNFEEALGNLNFRYALKNWESFKVCDYVAKEGALPSVEDWEKVRDLSGFRENLNNIIPFLNECFSGWIKSININEAQKLEIFNNSIDGKTSKFLNFNYTSTLEYVYNIPIDKICHVHIFNNNFIFGHGVLQNKILEYNNCYHNISVSRIFNQITELLYKRTSLYLKYNSSFFERLNNITDIYSYGFSFSDVDLPYIRRICEVVDTRNARWYQYSYNGSDYREIIEDCGFEGQIENW